MKFKEGQGVEYKSAIWTIEKIKEEAQTAVIANPDRRIHEKKNVKLSDLTLIKEEKPKPVAEAKVCIECKMLKPVEDFSWFKGKTKRNPRCKACAFGRANAGKELQRQAKLEEVSRMAEEQKLKLEPVEDQVKQPKHYQGTQGLEVIEIMKNFLPKYQDGYVAGMIKDVIKYILRAPSKGNLLQDLKKAREYLNYAIEYLEAG
ncbi:TPA: DUF3310 domain-containing protein [Streptococcus suis]